MSRQIRSALGTHARGTQYTWNAVHVERSTRGTHCATDRRSLEELLWSDGKALCREESKSERAERMVTGGGESATPRKTSGAKTVGAGKIRK